VDIGGGNSVVFDLKPAADDDQQSLNESAQRVNLPTGLLDEVWVGLAVRVSVCTGRGSLTLGCALGGEMCPGGVHSAG
jgi:hypothetical protein